jgi:hypothetical protein
MKFIKSALAAAKSVLTASLVVAALLSFCLAPVVKADQYRNISSIWTATSITNIPAATTNLAATINVTAFSSFVLDVQTWCTNNSGGWLDIHYCTSQDNTNFCDSPDTTITGGKSGVISIPLTNTGISTFWSTNITVGANGYWQIDWITNNTTCHFTNIQIKAYIKPATTF